MLSGVCCPGGFCPGGFWFGGILTGGILSSTSRNRIERSEGVQSQACTDVTLTTFIELIGK